VHAHDVILDLILDLGASGQRAFGHVLTANAVQVPTSVLPPDTHGWASWLRVECKHGIASLKSEVSGSMAINNHSIGFQDTRLQVPGRAAADAIHREGWGSYFPAHVDL